MRRQHDVREVEQLVRHGRLVREDVEPGAQPSRDELAHERRFVDDLAARRVHETRPVAQQRKSPCVDHSLRLGRTRRVDRDDVALAQEVVELPILAELGLDLPPLRVEHPNLEAACATGDRAADPAQPDNAERRSRHFASEEAVCPRASPPARANDAVTLRDAPPDGQDQRHREVGRCRVEHTWGVRHGDPAACARGDVDPVDADAEVGDEPKRRKQLERHGLVGNDERSDIRAGTAQQL
jgi:hypothetical protein